LAPEVTEVLLKAGVPFDQSDPDGRTPLCYAAGAGNAGVVKLLLNAGADPNPRPSGVSPLQCAREAAEFARSRRPVSFGGKPTFVPDFDGVIAALEQALAKRKQR
jgi:ankyrin repeat protein